MNIILRTISKNEITETFYIIDNFVLFMSLLHEKDSLLLVKRLEKENL